MQDMVSSYSNTSFHVAYPNHGSYKWMPEHIEDIVGLLFKYILLLQKSGVTKWIFDEVILVLLDILVFLVLKISSALACYKNVQYGSTLLSSDLSTLTKIFSVGSKLTFTGGFH